MLNTHAQQVHVFEEWATNEGVQEFFYKNITVSDADRNVYVAGATLNENGDYDLLITKYDRRGELLWTDTIAGSGGGHDFATDLVIDHQGNVLVCGSVSESSGQNNNLLLVKFDASGFEYWRYSYDYEGQNEAAASLCVDVTNHIYVTGAAHIAAGYADMITLKVSNAGTLLWAEYFDFNQLHDLGVKIALSGPRAVVTGVGQSNALSWRALAISYLQTDGTLTGQTSSGSAAPGFEEVTDLWIDTQENVYIAGSKTGSSTGYDMLLIKLDEDLNLEWTREWDGDGMTDKASGVRVAPNGDVYLCGTTQTASQGTDVVLLKYNAAGNQIWSQTYNGAHNADDEGASLEWLEDGYLYVAGSSFVVSSLDYLTLKYDTTGTLLWEITYNSPHNKNDRATNMAIDEEGDIIVSGQCEINDSTTTYYTVKYSEIQFYQHDFNDSQSNVYNHGYIENQGQLLDSNGLSIEEIKYYSTGSQYHTFASDTGWSVVRYLNSPVGTENDTVIKIGMFFKNYQIDCKVRAYDKLSNFKNFYFKDHSPFERVELVGSLLYKNVWNKIDVQHFSSATNEIQFTLSPTAKPSDIKFDLHGFDSVKVDTFGVLYLFSQGTTFKVGALKAYQEQGGNMSEKTWTPLWSFTDSTLSINNIGSFNTGVPLVLRTVADPCLENEIQFEEDLCYSSYFGGSGDDFIRGMIQGHDGDVIIYGFTANYFLFPQQDVVIGEGGQLGSQLFCTRFDEDFVPIYTSVIYGEASPGNFSTEIYTYDGTVHEEHIYLCGRSSGIFEEFGPQVELSDEDDSNAFIVGLNYGLGTAFWSTRLSGSGNDMASGVRVDDNGNVIVVGQCDNQNSSFPFEPLSGAYNSSVSGKSGFIALFDPDLQLTWCTAFGGTGDDVINTVEVLSTGEILISGITKSPDLYIEPVSNSHQIMNLTDQEGNYFIAKFSSAGDYVWSTYIGGEALYDSFVYLPMKLLAEKTNGSFYFAASINEVSNFDDFDDGTSHYFNDPISSPGGLPYHHNYSFIKEFDSNCDLSWSSLIDEGGELDQVTRVVVEQNKLLIGRSLVSSNPIFEDLDFEYYEDEFPTWTIGANTFQSADAMVTVFDTYANQVQYSTLIGGFDLSSYSKSIHGIIYNGDNELFICGGTKSAYNCGDYARFGVPVNDEEGDYFWANNPGVLDWNSANSTGYITKFCFLENTPLSIFDRNSSKSENEISVFPNPCSGNQLTVVSINNSKLDAIVVYSIAGRRVAEYRPGISDDIIQIPVSNLRSGTYLLEAFSEENVYRTKVVIQ